MATRSAYAFSPKELIYKYCRLLFCLFPFINEKARVKKFKQKFKKSVRALINLAVHLAVGGHKARQQILRRTADAINHVAAHGCRLVTQGVSRTAHGATLIAILAGEPVALFTRRGP